MLRCALSLDDGMIISFVSWRILLTFFMLSSSVKAVRHFAGFLVKNIRSFIIVPFFKLNEGSDISVSGFFLIRSCLNFLVAFLG